MHAQPQPGAAAGGVTDTMHGFAKSLTSFIGRASDVAEVTRLLGDYQLVTVTGPGGMGKTRLAAEVARGMAGRFADGVWLAELATVREPPLVQAAVAAALGVQQASGMSVVGSLTAVLAQRQLLLVLDNCEHVLAAAAELCGIILQAADDVRILATSREPLRMAGETRYRLGPLTLPPAGAAAAPGSEAIALFADRARQADPQFAIGPDSAAAVARLVRRLDGMPLAIELAAARVEALGVAQLADRLDDRFRLLAAGDRLAVDRQRSLAATAQWSYELLGDHERRVFRRLAAIPGPFTLEAAEAVAGADAGPAVLHLVDCSLLTPPRTGPDARARYLMLETLRAYGAEQLAEVGEDQDAAAALTRFALDVSERAAAGLETSAGEVDAARWLDAEDATVHHALAWAMEHDPPSAVRLALALAPWWLQRGRWTAGYDLLTAAAGHALEGEQEWCAAQYWLGLLAAGVSHEIGLRHYTAVRDAMAGRPPSPLLSMALTCRGGCLANLGHIGQAAPEVRRALALARQVADPAAEAWALEWLAILSSYTEDHQGSVAWCRQARLIDRAGIPGWIGRMGDSLLAGSLIEVGELAEAQQICAGALAAARHAGALKDVSECLLDVTRLDLLTGRLPEAAAHLREAIEFAMAHGLNLLLLDGCLDLCGHLCARTGRPAEALTLWAALTACEKQTKMPGLPAEHRHRKEPLDRARQALGSSAARAAEERGAAMGLAAAAEYVALLVAEDPGRAAGPPGVPGPLRLSARERELVTLVAQGRTDSQIAGQLYISVRTVRTHLDRIRDKTGCRRRADLTRLALETGLV